MAQYFHSNDKRFMYIKISSVYPREVDMIKMTLNSARESCTLLPSAAAMCGEIFSSGGRGGGGGWSYAPGRRSRGGGGGGGGVPSGCNSKLCNNNKQILTRNERL